MWSKEGFRERAILPSVSSFFLKYLLSKLCKPYTVLEYRVWSTCLLPSSLLFSCSIVSDFLWPYEMQHTRLPCPSLSPGVSSNSCPLSRWCHPTISSSVIPFSSRLQSFPASGSFLMSQFFPSGGQVLELQLQHQSFQWILRIDIL